MAIGNLSGPALDIATGTGDFAFDLIRDLPVVVIGGLPGVQHSHHVSRVGPGWKYLVIALYRSDKLRIQILDDRVPGII